MKKIRVPVSPGELLDKITILEIKSERMNDPKKIANVNMELARLRETWADCVKEDDVIKDFYTQLKNTNEALWDIEDDIRDKERARDFGARFIELARSVYATNDRRAKIKRDLNRYLGSAIVEEKSYPDYL